MKLADAFIHVLSDNSGLDFGGARRKTDGFVSSAASRITTGLGSAFRRVGALALSGMTIAGTAVLGFGANAISAGSDVEEMQAKFETVFKNTAPQVTAELDAFAGAVGRNRYELRSFAATLGDTLKPLGFAEEDAADLSSEMVQLATDLGSFNDLGTATVMQDLQSAIVGNTETLRKYGIVASQAAIEEYALANGIWDGVDAITAQEKASAIMGLTIQGSADAIGDAQRTSGSWANQMRALKSRLGETTAEIGMALLPVLTPLLGKLGDLAERVLPVVTGAVGILVDAWREGALQFEEGGGVIGFLIGFLDQLLYSLGASEETIASVTSWLQALRDGLAALGTRVSEAMGPIIESVAGFVSWQDVLIVLGGAIAAVVIPAIVSIAAAVAPVVAIVAAAVAGVALMRTAWEENWGGIQEKTEAVAAWVGPRISAAIEAVRAAVETGLAAVQQFWSDHGAAIMELVGALWEAIKLLFEGALENIRLLFQGFQQLFAGDWEGLGETVREIVTNIVTTLSDIFGTLWDAISPYLTEIWDNLVTWVTTTDWLQVGRDIIDGIIDGMAAAGAAIGEFLRGLLGDALDDVKTFFGISSPSKRTAAEVGVPLAQGIGQGFEQAMAQFRPNLSLDGALAGISVQRDESISVNIDSMNIAGGDERSVSDGIVGGLTELRVSRRRRGL